MDLSLVRDARMLIRDFVKLRAEESVVLLTDQRRREEAEALRIAVDECGSAAIIVDITSAVAKVLDGEEFWRRPPDAVVSAMNAANVTIATVDETYAFRLDHKLRELVSSTASCSVFKVDVGMGTWSLTPRDLERVGVIERAIRTKMDGANLVHVTTDAGTDVELSLKGRDCLPVRAVPERGLPYAIPIPLWGEYNWAPIEGSVNGRIVIDGITEATSNLRVVSEPVTWLVEDGRVVDVQGGKDADDFRRVVQTDSGASCIGELGVGGNPKAIPGTETEKALLGTVHFGLGQNDEYPGGTIQSAIHVDGVVRRATLEADGTAVLRDGRLVSDETES